MFANTLTLTIATVAHVLNRVNQDAFGSEYQYNGATSSIIMKIRHTQDSPDADGIAMKRHNVFVERVIYPTASEQLKKQTFTATMRGGKLEDPIAKADLAASVVDWLDTSGVLTDLSVGVN